VERYIAVVYWRDAVAEPAPKISMDELAILPPSFDLAAAMEFAKTTKDFARLVDRFDAEATLWRARASQDFRALRERIDAQTDGHGREEVWPQLQPLIERALKILDAGIEAHSVPVDKDPRFAEPLARLRRVSSDLAHFFRRHLKRADAVRQKQLAAYEKIRDDILVLKWDYDPEAQPTPGTMGMSSAEDIERYFESIR
jgi:hypothetical protein